MQFEPDGNGSLGTHTLILPGRRGGGSEQAPVTEGTCCPRTPARLRRGSGCQLGAQSAQWPRAQGRGEGVPCGTRASK